MGVLYQSPDLALPWSSSRREDSKFTVFAIIFLLLVFIGGPIIQHTKLPEKDRKELEKVPESLVKIIKKKKEKPKPKPKPKPEKKPEKKPEPEKPKEKPKPKPKPKPEDIKKARAKAKKSGLLKETKALKEMANLFAASNTNKPLSKAGAKSVKVNRNTIVGNSNATSGGIKTAALPTTSGVASIDGRNTTQVDSVTLGGTAVDTGDDVGEAVASGGSSGSRSEERIRAVLDQNKGALYRTYQRALREDPALQGKVTFELTIEPSGEVSNCVIVSSELNDPKLERKLVARMKFLDFGAEDVSVTVTRWAVDFLPF